MGLTYLELDVVNPARPEKTKTVQFLVDSGAIYSLVPRQVLDELGIEPTGEEHYYLANGEKISRKRGNAFFSYQGKLGAAPVIFGEEGDAPLLGAVTLESLGVVLDPFHRELRPLKLMLAGIIVS
ncbi:MAG: aspartyl protease family protein [Deltaproteobacteria bacterium]|nr:aspartyl protease family protein [Deltaproteobacteria bacterium]